MKKSNRVPAIRKLSSKRSKSLKKKHEKTEGMETPTKKSRNKRTTIRRKKKNLDPDLAVFKKQEIEKRARKHYTIGIVLFWTVLAIVANFFFWSGYYVGTIKYDIEKINLADANRNLMNEFSAKSDTIRFLDSSINALKLLSNKYYRVLPKQ
jgi:hypothetical protein